MRGPDLSSTPAVSGAMPEQPGRFQIPVIPHGRQAADSENGSRKKRNGRIHPRRDIPLSRDAVFEVVREGACHVVSESYFYKTAPYYTVLRHELEGREVRPTSRAILEAGVVPVCLERASLAGIPVCDWGISQGFTPVPAILYGLHYFSTASEFRVVGDADEAKEAVRHITNKGKYPFCYQPLDDGASITTTTAVFGRTASREPAITAMAEQVYRLYAIPLVTLVMVHDNRGYRLSSLALARYSHLSAEERSLLMAYLGHQEFL